ncbi:MAG TPA: pyruvate carboxylase [Steroidobacteraceae bacterium]|nr:pyruvate carboxylase [Steroidobacteraceae bacterium]
MARRIHRLLVANRGEIAIRVMRAASELGLATVAIYSQEDRFSLHRTKSDEAYLVGRHRGPVEAYLDIPDILRIAREAHVDAIHPGYGFLAENPQFARACAAAGILFIGPSPETMESLGNKVAARNLAIAAGVPVMPATPPLPVDIRQCMRLAHGIGYPVMLKASWGGGGRGMRIVASDAQLAELLPVARRESQAAFGNDEVYLEKLVSRARHIEVQILGDRHGELVHLFERDCTVQRRNQKVVERAPAVFLSDQQRVELCAAALKIGRAARYVNAGTVEFLQDADTGKFYFIEVNPRIQVEHTVTECVTGIDLVKAQIRIAEGAQLGTPESGVPPQADIRIGAHALQCRVTTEDPENNFIPDYGRMSAYRSPAGFGIRLDAGTAYAGAFITRSYDSLLVKVTSWSPTPEETIARMHRALWEFRIRGVVTNLRFLDQLITHPRFARGDYTTRFIDETPELFRWPRKRDRATRILTFLADTIVNGNVETRGRSRPGTFSLPELPGTTPGAPPAGTRQKLDELGPKAFAGWMARQQRVLLTDTTMRDAHQSLLATRVRSIDLTAIAPYYSTLVPELFSMECWGGATFDVAMRFLHEDPWHRLTLLREAMPNLLLQMLLRSANAVGYTNYPDNVVRFFVARAAERGIDLFRIFDSLNWTDNMRVAIDAVLESGKLCEAAICYTGNLSDPHENKYTLNYYVQLARELEAAGTHILGIKDMAGLCRPRAAYALVKALKEEVGLPIHFHTHDTSGIAAASVLAAVDAGADAVDGAIDAMSGLTSQPNLGSIVEALRFGPRDPGVDPAKLRMLSAYWEQTRKLYGAFESDIRSGASEVYVHGMPGGQYTNLREQARALGIGDARWPEVAQAYADVNLMFGDIVKVTPTSKVVGDLALMMVTSGLTPQQVLDPRTDVAFPESVVQLFRGDLGQPNGGFPAQLQSKVLNGQRAFTERPGARLPPTDLEAAREQMRQAASWRQVTDDDLASYLMYPKVWLDYAQHRKQYGDVGMLPTPVFFYGMETGQEISVDLERGKTLIVRFIAVSDVHEDGTKTVFFELNGQPREVRVADRSQVARSPPQRKAEPGNPQHVGAPMPGTVATISAAVGRKVARGDVLATLEAMKMETAVRAEIDGEVAEVLARPGQQVDAKDLLVVLA